MEAAEAPITAAYPCPLCGRTNPRPVTSVSGFSRCSCGLVCNDQEEPPEGYHGDYFTAEEPAMGHRDFESAAASLYDERRFGEELRRVGPPPAGGRLLDVGSATGAFLETAARRGWNVVGVEISDEARALARQRGVESFPDLDDVADRAPFSLITLHHVLEHLAEPVATLSRLKDLLGRDGRFLIEVPNWRSLERRSMGPGWTDLRPEQHRWQFDPESLQRLCELAGFEVATIATAGEPVPTAASVLRSLGVRERWLDAARRRRRPPSGVNGYPAASPTSDVVYEPNPTMDSIARVIDSVESRALLGKRLIAIGSAAR